MESQSLVASVKACYMVEFVHFALRELEIHLLMIQLRILSMILKIFSITLHNPSTRRILGRTTIGSLGPPNFPLEPMNTENWVKLSDLKQALRGRHPMFIRSSMIAQIVKSFMLLVLSFIHKSFTSSASFWESKNIIPLNEINSQTPSSVAITTSPLVLSIEDPEDSLIMGNEELSTIPEKESNEFIKSSVEDLVPIPSESEDTSGSVSVYILPSCDDFSPIDIPEEKAVTFSNPLFNSNDDFISSDDESLSNEDIPKDNVKIYLNPLFEFDDEYISSHVNPLFDEVLEDIECKDSYDPNLDELTFLVTHLSDYNEDEYFTPGDDIELLLHHDPFIPKMSVASILEGFTNEPPLEENNDLFDLEFKNDEWKKILYDA
nr:hypothetical protein [Tanacetum cinerariifolium]